MGYVLNNKDKYVVALFDLSSLYYDGAYLHTGCANSYSDTIRAFSFDGSSISFSDSRKLFPDGWSDAMVALGGDGNNVYCGGNSHTTLWAVPFSGGVYGAPTAKSLPSNPTALVCDSSGYIYVGCSNGSIYAYSFVGGAFIARGSVSTGGTRVRRLVFTGTHVVAAIDGATDFVIAYTFDGVAFTPAGSVNQSGAGALYYDGSHFHFGNSYGARANLYSYSYNGAVFTKVHDIELPYTGVSRYPMGVVGDGRNLYVTVESQAVYSVVYDAVSGYSIESAISNTDIVSGLYNVVEYFEGHMFYASGGDIWAIRNFLLASFVADRTVGVAPLTVNFTAT